MLTRKQQRRGEGNDAKNNHSSNTRTHTHTHTNKKKDEMVKQHKEIFDRCHEQFYPSNRHHIQEGLYLDHYDNIAKDIGCYPYPELLLRERPEAVWAAWFTPWTAVQYRLVGKDKSCCFFFLINFTLHSCLFVFHVDALNPAATIFFYTQRNTQHATHAHTPSSFNYK